MLRRQAIEILSIGIANIVFLMGIDFFVVGGGLANAGKELFVPLREKVNELISVTYKKNVNLNVKIVPAKLGNMAGLVGAAQLVMESQNA